MASPKPVVSPAIVVGAGIAGVACARALTEAGMPVTVLDRGHRVGGRMASRTTDGRPVDIGASYFTVSDPAFQAVVDDWQTRGLARPWTDTFAVLSDGDRTSTSGPMRWAAERGLRSLVEDLADGLEVTSARTISELTYDEELMVDGHPAEAVVLAMPDPQARRLLIGELQPERDLLSREYEPVLALTATFATRTWGLDGAFVSDDETLGFLADDGSRRGDGAPVLVAHSTSELAAAHLEHPSRAEPVMTDALRRLLDLPEPRSTSIHRWSFARPAEPREEPYGLTERGIGFCGDGWHGKPRVEGAYLSGRALGEAMADRLARSGVAIKPHGRE